MVLSKVSPEVAAATLALLPEAERVQVMAGMEESELSKLMTHMGMDAPPMSSVDAEAKKRVANPELKSGKGVYVGPMDLYKQSLVDIRKLKTKGVNIAYASRKGQEDLVPTVSRIRTISWIPYRHSFSPFLLELLFEIHSTTGTRKRLRTKRGRSNTQAFMSFTRMRGGGCGQTRVRLRKNHAVTWSVSQTRTALTLRLRRLASRICSLSGVTISSSAYYFDSLASTMTDLFM